MNKQEFGILLALLGLFFFWPTIHRKFIASPQPANPTSPSNVVYNPTNTVGVATNPQTGTPVPPATPGNPLAGTGGSNGVPFIAAPLPLPTNPAAQAPGLGNPSAGSLGTALPTSALIPANRVTLKNDKLEIDFSKIGACIIEARMPDYDLLDEPNSPIFSMDFSDRPTLALHGLTGAGVTDTFSVNQVSPQEVTFSAVLPGGATFIRTLKLGDGYDIEFSDTLQNGASDTLLNEHDLLLGWMNKSPTYYKYTSNAAVDAYLLNTSNVEYFNSSLFGGTGDMSKWVRKENGPINRFERVDPKWVAVKNKFFATIISIKDTTWPLEGMYLLAEPLPGEEEVERVASALAYRNTRDNNLLLKAGKSMVRTGSLYVGPKKFDELEKLSMNQVKILEFRKLTFLCVPVLKILNFFHGIFGNYGIAIILLTVGMRLIFWPLTRITAHNGKKMAQLSPLMKEISEHYKEDPRKKQAAIMDLYKKYKVNPMKGCFPMLVQIPVFFSLYFVIRSVIELRFADFLWIKDLSEAERLFTDTVGFPVNFLPFLMAGSTLLQQKLTPNSMDPLQQKIMMFMPIMFLFILYAFPSGLLLYWTTSNLLMALQTYFNMKSVPQLDVPESLFLDAGKKKKSGKKKSAKA